MSKLRDDFIKWQVDKVGTPFVEDETFFRERYGTLITPLCKDLFKELLEIDARLCRIEHDTNEMDDCD